ncbi:MAG: hypothetical protein GX810_06340 [Clostridiales bacterium]|nr:hypothetical protein [Clostridiales bacterium]
MSLSKNTAGQELARVNTDSGLIRTVAILTMIVDHVGVIFFPSLLWLRVIGRIAFPLFCWGIVVGAVFTRDLRGYALRLLVLAVVCQGAYMLALRHALLELNVVFTLFLGLVGVIGMRVRRYGSQLWAPALALLLSASIQMDYGWRGVLLIQLMYLARTTPGGLSALMVAFCLYWGSSSTPVQSLLGLPRDSLGTPWPLKAALDVLYPFLRLQGLALLALPLMVIKTRSGIRIPKWLSYAAYPGHLAILYGLSLLLNG